MQWSKITDAQTPIRPLWGVIECVPQSRLKKKNHYTPVEWLATQLKPPQNPGVDPLEVIIVGRLMKEAEHGDTKGRTLKARSKHASIALAELLITGGLALIAVWGYLGSRGGK